jgi:cysteine desulfurase
MIYADYNGSAPICADVKDYLVDRIQNGPYSNPNAIHHLGQKVLMGMENARFSCSKILGCKPSQILFNSGSTEGISHIFYSLLCGKLDEGRNIIITSGIEHSAVVKTAQFYEEKGFQVKVCPTLPSGVINFEALEILLKENQGNVALVCIMAANNETGVIQPYEEMAEACQKYDAPIFSDTTQLIGKDEFSFDKSGLDYAVLSGHKIGALTGTGMILAKDLTTLKPFIIGGGQEKDLRGGTQNYLGNETLAVALNYFKENKEKLDALKAARTNFEKKLKEKFPTLVIMGEDAPRLASSTYISYPGIHGQAVQIELESEDIYVTTSSACSDNEPVTSKVLKAMGVNDEVGRGVVRISLGLCSPIEWYDQVFDALSRAYEKLGKIKSF